MGTAKQQSRSSSPSSSTATGATTPNLQRRGNAAAQAALRDPGMQRAAEGAPSEVPFLSEMESAFGVDFGGVTAYLGAEGLGAPAAAEGETIAFAERNPSKTMVAHELAHVVQGRQGGSGEAEGAADLAGLRAGSGAKVGAVTGGGEGVHHWEPGDAHDAESRHWSRMADAAAESMDGILEDIEDEVTGAAREELPGLVGPLAARLHPQLGRVEGVLTHVNTLVETGEHVHHAIELVEAVRAFDSAFSGAGSGAPHAIREAGGRLASLCDAAGALLDLLPDELAFLKLPVMTMLRVAGRMGRVGANVFADYFDRINAVAYLDSRTTHRGTGSGSYDPSLLHRFAMALGPKFISDITDTESSAAAEASLVADSTALVQKLRDRVDPSWFADYLGGEDPAYEGAAQAEALEVLAEVEANLRTSAARCSHEIMAANRFRILATGATEAINDRGQADGMLAILNRGHGSIPHTAGHLLNRGTQAGVASPTDVGYRI